MYSYQTKKRPFVKCVGYVLWREAKMKRQVKSEKKGPLLMDSNI